MSMGMDWADKPENIRESREIIEKELERIEENESNI